MPNANSFPDGQRGRTTSGDLGRVADYSASTLPVRGPGIVGRRFPGGSTVTALPVRRAGGSGGGTPPLTILDASGKDAQGNPHPGRVRVTLGYLDGLRPSEMTFPDTVLPDGTDNRCYLTIPDGGAYVRGKLMVDKSAGLNTGASVYVTPTQEPKDKTFVYFDIGYVVLTDGTLSISQINTGNQSLAVLVAPDGTFSPVWNAIST